MSELGKVDDKSSLNISLSYLVQIIVVISIAVWGYANITEKIDKNAQETRNLRANQNNYVSQSRSQLIFFLFPFYNILFQF